MKLLFSLASTLLLATASADLTCSDFIYGNSATNQGYMAFGQAGNLTVGNLRSKNLHVAQGMDKKLPGGTGRPFALRECSSSSLDTPASCIQPGNDAFGGGAYYTYSTTVQVIDVRTNLCMTRSSSVYGNVNFQRCNTDPRDDTQLWGASQQYFPDDTPVVIEPVNIVPLESAAWEAASNKYGTMSLAEDSNALYPTVTTFSATGDVPYVPSTIQQCRT